MPFSPLFWGRDHGTDPLLGDPILIQVLDILTNNAEVGAQKPILTSSTPQPPLCFFLF